MRGIIVGIYGIFIFTFAAFSQSLVINEVVSSNDSTFLDEDGDSPDWIEIYNASASPQNLNGLGLSDDPDDPFKWVFPNFVVEGGDFLTVFASNKDRRLSAFWETIVDWGDDWRYFVGTSEPPSDWNMVSFDDNTWSTGPSGFGYSDGDDATVIPATVSVYIRKKFTITNVADVNAILLHVDYDDAFIAYINGQEVARENIGSPGAFTPYNQGANTWREAEIYQGGQPNGYLFTDVAGLLQAGENVISIQGHNSDINSSDMSLIPFLSLGLAQEPSPANGLNPLLDFSLPKFHTNFRLSAGGESLYLTKANNQLEDSVQVVSLLSDVSYGRQPDGGNNWMLFPEPTPGESNTTQGYGGFAEQPGFSHNAGFYDGTIAVTLTKNDPNTVIHYTTNGSEPTQASPVYTSPIQVVSTTVVRARGFAAGTLPDHSVASTYILNDNISLPVISISTAPENLWDDETGIYVLGNDHDPNPPYFGANFWEDWERPIHIELFEPDGSLGFSTQAGVKIFGGWSRANPQKSLSVFFRGRYGVSELDYPLFPGHSVTTFHSFVLRNSGNDWNNTMFWDAAMQSHLEGIDIDGQAYRPAVLFINGQYWGIQNIREKLNERYLESHYGVDPDNVDMLEWNDQVIEGDNLHYQAMLDYLAANNVAQTQHYEYIKTQMDVDNFIRYTAAQIYFDNTDWPGNNIKYWRPRTADGRWRWMMFDTDFGFGLYNVNNYQNNTLDFATEPNGPGWPNPPWSTYLLRELLKNNQFKIAFINQFSDYMNGNLRPAFAILRINEMENALQPEMERHFSQWQGNHSGWSNRVNNMRVFATQRPLHMTSHIISHFGLTGTAELAISSVPNGGSVAINSLTLDQFPWTGQYFKNMPLEITALPAPGYQFVRWEGASTSTSPTITLHLLANESLAAIFAPGNTPENTVVINEINYNSSMAFDPEDWVELYNNTDNAIDLSGWQFWDTESVPHSYTIPAGTILNADSYLVLVRDATFFTAAFPNVSNFIGDIGFGLSGGGELVRLLDAQGNVVDSLTYDDNAPWPDGPDGNGPTLSLIHPDRDNSLAENWAASLGFGTPGAINDVFMVGIEEVDETLPTAFKLYPNFPNPFNPKTEIRFDLPSNERVRLTVYDILGRKVTTLVDEPLRAGRYRFSWQPQGRIASGIYIYQLQASGSFLEQRKMILLK